MYTTEAATLQPRCFCDDSSERSFSISDLGLGSDNGLVCCCGGSGGEGTCSIGCSVASIVGDVETDCTYHAALELGEAERCHLEGGRTSSFLSALLRCSVGLGGLQLALGSGDDSCGSRHFNLTHSSTSSSSIDGIHDPLCRFDSDLDILDGLVCECSTVGLTPARGSHG